MRLPPFFTIVCCCLVSFLSIGQTPELVVPTGHAAPISAIALSSDGQYLLSGSLDGVAVLWDHNGDQLKSLSDLSVYQKTGFFADMYTDEASVYGIGGLAILEDGRMVTGSKSGKLIIWKSDGTKEKELEGHAKSINAIAIAPNGQQFAAGDNDGHIILWNLSGEVVWKKKGAHSKVSSLAFSPDGKELYSGGRDRVIRAWDSSSGDKLRDFGKTKGQGNVLDLAVSPDGTSIIAGNLSRTYLAGPKSTRTAFVFNKEGDVIRELDQHKGAPLAATFTPQSGIPVIGTSNGEVIMYPEQGTPIMMEVHTGDVTRLIADPNKQAGDEVISTGVDGKVVRLNPKMKKVEVEYRGLVGPLKGLGINNKGLMEVIWYGPDGKGGTFDLADRYVKAIKNIEEPITKAKYRGLYEGATELRDHILDYDGFVTKLERINMRTGSVEKSDAIDNHRDIFLRVLSPDASRGFAAIDFIDDVETNSAQAGMALLDPDQNRRRHICGMYLNYETGQIHNLRGHGKMIIAAAISNDNQKLLTGGRDQSAILWDAQFNKTYLDGHNQSVTAVAFSPDNQTIITAGEDQQLFFRDQGGRIRESISNLGFIPTHAIFSQDSRFLFLSGDQAILHVFEVDQAKKLGRLFLFNEGDWAFVGDDGLFDASPGAMENMYYVIPGNNKWEKLGLSQLKARFFEPSIIAKRLELSQERARSAEGLEDVPLFPIINAEIENDQLAINLKARSGGIGPVSVFINGKEVEQDANPDRKTQLTINLRPLQKYMHPTKGAENYISLRAYNKDAWLKSPAFTLLYKSKGGNPGGPNVGEGEADETLPDLYIVSIGTADYTGDRLDLQFADKDAAAMAMALQSVGRQLFSQVNQTNVFCLNTNEESKAALGEKNIQWVFAEKEKIKETFASIGKKAKAMDVIVIYLSGHGVSYGSAEQTHFHYLTHGISSEDLSDKAIRERYTISDDELTKWMNEIPALKQVLIIDACNSGQVVKNAMGTKNSKTLNSGQILAIDRMKDRTGMFVISGSAADKVSYEASEFGQGLLTYSLLQGMNGIAVRKTAQGDFIDVMNLLQYARDEVPQLASSIAGIQTPMLGFPEGGSSFDIGIYNDQVEIPLAVQKPVFIRSNFQNDDTYEDDQKLTQLLDMQLQREAAKGATADLVFVDLASREGAYSIKGRYTVKNGLVSIKARLFSPDGTGENLEIAGAADAKKMASLIYRAAKKAIRNR